MMRWCECGERVSVPSHTSVCPDCRESKRVERAVGAAPITIVMSSLVPPERKTIAAMIEEASTPGLDAGEAFAQQAAQWEAELASRAETVASPDWKSLLVTSAELAAVAVASRATAATLRAIGGPVAETIAARADETARTASEGALMAVAESAMRWVESGTEGER